MEKIFEGKIKTRREKNIVSEKIIPRKDCHVTQSFSLVCQAWHNSHGCKSRHGYLPPSVANHKPKTAMSRGRKWGSKVDEPTNRNQI